MICEPLQLVRPAIDETQLAPRQYVSNRRANEHLVRPRRVPWRQTPRWTATPVTAFPVEFDLPGVDAGADVEAECRYPFDRCAGGAHRRCGCVKPGEEAVTGGVDLNAAVPVQNAADLIVMPGEQTTQAESPTCCRRSVEATMSVNKTVASREARHDLPAVSPTILARATTDQRRSCVRRKRRAVPEVPVGDVPDLP